MVIFAVPPIANDTEWNTGERITRFCSHGTASCAENADDVVATSSYFLAFQVKTEDMV
jgi:hypothetical protein